MDESNIEENHKEVDEDFEIVDDEDKENQVENGQNQVENQQNQQAEVDELAELERMVLGCWVYETINRDDEWWKYIRQKIHKIDWYEKTGLNYLLTEHIFQQVVDIGCDPFWWFVNKISLSSSAVRCSLVRLISLTIDSREGDFEWNRALCLLLEKVFEKTDVHIPEKMYTLYYAADYTQHYVYNQDLDPEVFESSFRYLMGIFDSRHWLTIVWALKVILLLCRKELLGKGQRNQVRRMLQELVEMYDIPLEECITELYGNAVECARLRVMKVVRDYLQEDTEEDSPPIQKTTETIQLFAIGSNTTEQVFTRSAFAVSRGCVYYYELLLLTDDPSVTIGWMTRDATIKKAFQSETIIGEYGSVGLNLSSKTLADYYEKYCMKNQDSIHFTVGSVVGCAIDVEQGQFHYYLNEVQLEFDGWSHGRSRFSSEPYYIVASV